MNPKQRLERIRQLEATIYQQRAATKVLEDELQQLTASDTPADRAFLAQQWWFEMRVGAAITLDDFAKLLDICRELKQSSPAAACTKLRDTLNITMQEAAKYIRKL